MRIKIESSGMTGKGVKIINADDGEELKHVRRATIHLAAGEVNRAELEFVGTELDVIVQAELCRKSKKFVNSLRKEMEKVEREEYNDA